jgi:molybdopterin-containing oxidoreductase family membrane subunit
MPAQGSSSLLWKGWIALLLCLVGLGAFLYFEQFMPGYHHNIGLSRDVSWGLHIGQFTFFVGVAASAVVLLLPTYLHNYERFRPILLLGEILAVTALVISALFIIVDVGQPQRLFNFLLYPAPKSLLFWDMVVIGGYLLLSLCIARHTWNSRRLDAAPPDWLKKVIYLSIFWAFFIHTVTALIYCALPGRDYWLTAIMAARFLASAFCSGPAILLLLLLLLKRLTGFNPAAEALRSLTTIIVYALGANIFFFLLEVFTALYSGIPGHMHPMAFLFAAPEHWPTWAMRAAALMALAAFFLLALPSTRRNAALLPFALCLLVAATWIDKGLIIMVAGFTPNVFGRITPYTPSGWEWGVSFGLYALGALTISVLWRRVVRMEMGLLSRHNPDTA